MTAMYIRKFTQYLSTNPALQRIMGEKYQYKVGNYTLEKAIKKSSFNKPKRGYPNRILPLTMKITGSNYHLSLITLNISAFNSPVKRHRITDWVCKKDPTFCHIK